MDTTACVQSAALGELAILLGLDMPRVLEAAEASRVGTDITLGGWVGAISLGDDHIGGAGPRRIRRLQAARNLARYLAFEAALEGPLLQSPGRCEGFLRQHLRFRHRETFCCLFLDCRQRLLRCMDLFEGTIDSAAVYPREVVAAALRLGATGVIVAHNHPSGHAAPSAPDIAITEALRSALGLLDIRLLDHFIVAEDTVYSMAQHGDAGFA